MFNDLKFRIRDFFRYSKRELRDLAISIAIIALVFGYDDKSSVFNLRHWLFNYMQVFIMVAGAFFVHTAVQKIVALYQGFKVEYRAWMTGLGLSLIFTLLTQGQLYLILPGGLAMYHVTILRLGKWRYGENVAARGIIAMMGPIGNIILATICLTLSAQLNILPEFFGAWALVNFWYMAYSMLPIPKLDGIHIFFWSRLWYVFLFSTLLGYVLLTLLGVYSWFFALLIGLVCWFAFYWFVES